MSHGHNIYIPIVRDIKFKFQSPHLKLKEGPFLYFQVKGNSIIGGILFLSPALASLQGTVASFGGPQLLNHFPERSELHL